MPTPSASAEPATDADAATLRLHLAHALPEVDYASNDDRSRPSLAHSHADLIQVNVFHRTSGRITIDRHEQAIRSGNLYLIPAGCRHAINPARRQRGTTIRFRLPGYHAGLPGPVLELDAAGVEVVAGLLADAAVLHDADDAVRASLRLAEALILALRHGRGIGRATPPTNLAGRVAALIEAGFREELDVAELAARFGVTASHLCRAFHREVGQTPMSFLRQLRTARAAERLFRSREPIEDIAAQSGFGSVRNMRRAFQELHGMSPQRFRDQHREF